MADVINICLDSAKYPKCAGCPHNRPDQERSSESVCWLDQDLKGKERIEYLVRLLKEFSK